MYNYCVLQLIGATGEGKDVLKDGALFLVPLGLLISSINSLKKKSNIKSPLNQNRIDIIGNFPTGNSQKMRFNIQMQPCSVEHNAGLSVCFLFFRF